MRLFIDGDEPEVSVGLKLAPVVGMPNQIALVATVNGKYYDTILKINENGVYCYLSPKLEDLGFRLDKDCRIGKIDVAGNPVID